MQGHSFWHSLLHMWHGYNHHDPQSKVLVNNQIIAKNSCIKIGGVIVKFAKTRVLTITDIYENGTPLSYESFSCRFPECKLSWYYYMSLISAIPEHGKLFLHTEGFIDNQVTKIDSIAGLQKVSRWIYHDKLSTDCILRRVAGTWNIKLNSDLNVNDIKLCFKAITTCTHTVKLQDFQYRLLLNKIFCNDILIYWKKVDSNLCNICYNNKQTITHLMFYCRKIRPIWCRIQALLRRAGINCTFNAKNVILNKVVENTNDACNVITLICKQFIYRCKCQDEILTFKDVVYQIKTYYRIELFYNYFQLRRIKCMWSPVINALSM